MFTPASTKPLAGAMFVINKTADSA